MEATFLNNLSPEESQALNFAAMTCAMLIAVLAAWGFATFGKRKRKRKRKHHGHDRINPTRAEIGGLPPPRAKTRQPARADGDGESPFDP